ncbi:nucleoporin NUP42 isoform X1 [Ochotona curzoniae]|uniref:nucleoporin NUP42 isoform X1 n=1 Tax=Ochotona curzoniae TaxID=130825 RepID=UPI001B34FF2A|nr:nucleoporin NUP42 isoform X1 [Ochotona curzoniae]
MTVCQFFLQGRCRFGERCWNEHPGARGTGGGGRQQLQQPPSGGNRRGWNPPSQRYSSVIQPSSFSRSAPWGDSRDQERSFDSGTATVRNRGFGLSENSFASLDTHGQEDEKKLLEGIIKDMMVWKSSGQWMFSVYSPIKRKSNISGFTDISPEELRLEYHNFLTSNNLQSYLNSVQQLVNQWSNRVDELKTINASTKAALLSDTKDGMSEAAPALGFGSSQTTFGSPGFPVKSSSDNAQAFNFKLSSGFGTTPSGGPAVFGGPPAFGVGPAAGAASTPSFGFGKPEVTSAAAFSFKSPTASNLQSPGFSGFAASSAAGAGGAPGAPAFGSSASAAGFGQVGSQSHAAFSKPSSNIFGSSSSSFSLPASNATVATDNTLFTPKDQLTTEELEQFQSRKFTLGKIPLKPPPLELLNI